MKRSSNHIYIPPKVLVVISIGNWILNLFCSIVLFLTISSSHLEPLLTYVLVPISVVCEKGFTQMWVFYQHLESPSIVQCFILCQCSKYSRQSSSKGASHFSFCRSFNASSKSQNDVASLRMEYSSWNISASSIGVPLMLQ